MCHVQAQPPYTSRCAAATREQRLAELARPRTTATYEQRRAEAEDAALKECTFAPQLRARMASAEPRRAGRKPGVYFRCRTTTVCRRDLEPVLVFAPVCSSH